MFYVCVIGSLRKYYSLWCHALFSFECSVWNVTSMQSFVTIRLSATQLLVTKLSPCALIGWISVPSYSCVKLLLDLLTGCSRLFPLKWSMTQKSETLVKYVYQLLLFNNILEPYWHFHWRVFWCSLLRYRDGFIDSSQSHTSEFHRALLALHKLFKAVLLIGKSWWVQNQSNIQQWKWWWCYGVAPEMCL